MGRSSPNNEFSRNRNSRSIIIVFPSNKWDDPSAMLSSLRGVTKWKEERRRNERKISLQGNSLFLFLHPDANRPGVGANGPPSYWFGALTKGASAWGELATIRRLDLCLSSARQPSSSQAQSPQTETDAPDRKLFDPFDTLTGLGRVKQCRYVILWREFIWGEKKKNWCFNMFCPIHSAPCFCPISAGKGSSPLRPCKG